MPSLTEEDLFRSIINVVSDILILIGNINIEREIFVECGCYLYRTSSIITELQTVENTQPNAMGFLGPILDKLESTKDLIGQCSTFKHPVAHSDMKGIAVQLERFTRDIGEFLRSISPPLFENKKYAEIAVQTLSREMQNAKLGLIDPVKLKEESQLGLQNSHPRQIGMPRLADFLRGMHFDEEENGKLTVGQPQKADHVGPLYETFLCPLTKKIMDDPVTIQSGATFERSAITEWFKCFGDNWKDVVCPVTGKKLLNRAFSDNLALKTMIQEWKDRNEAKRIKLAHSALSSCGSERSVLLALRDLQLLCQMRNYNAVQMRSVGLMPLLCQLLKHQNGEVRCEAYKTLTILVEDEEGKEMVAILDPIAAAVRMLSSNNAPLQDASVSFLLELSKSEKLCELIGSVTGAILLLVTMKDDKSIEASSAQKAEKILENLGRFPNNIKCMAENGFVDPLLNNLTLGSEEMQINMGIFLGEIGLGRSTTEYVAERASASLIKMIQSGNTLSRGAALRALVQISSRGTDTKTLVEAGVAQTLVTEILKYKIPNGKEESSGGEPFLILANILQSGVDPETIFSKSDDQVTTLDYAVQIFISILRDTMEDDVKLSIIKILLPMMKFEKPAADIVNAIQESEATSILVELMKSGFEELSNASTNLLIKLSSSMGHTVAETLCSASIQAENLISKVETGRITEKQAVSAELLAKLPCQHLALNAALLRNGTVPTVLHNLQEIQRYGMGSNKFAEAYLESLVGILVRFTTTLHDHEMLQVARKHDLALVLTMLLTRAAGSDEVQRLAAFGLHNLSAESTNLSRQPVEVDKPNLRKSLRRYFSVRSQQSMSLRLCPVHRGPCSPSTTFCLLESKAVARLLGCLEHENHKVVEAALSAICTLLDDGVDVDKSVAVLGEFDAMQHILNVLRQCKEKQVCRKSFWLIEKFLTRGEGRSLGNISSDRLLPSALVASFHDGDDDTKRLAEKILMCLNKMPNFSM